MNSFVEYGIISNEKDILNKYTNLELNKLKYLRYDLKKKLVAQDDTVITTINVHPVDRLCYGSCNYCYNNSYYYDKNFGKISPERFEKFLTEIQPWLSDDVAIKFTGGSCFLYNNIYDLINIAKKYIKNLHVRFHADLMYDEVKYNEVLGIFDRLVDDNDILTVSMYITTDYGSDTRCSKYLNINSDTIKKRAEHIVDTYGNYNKFQIELKININSETDEKRLLSELEKIVNKNCFIIYNPVRDLKYTPSIKQLKNIVDTIEKVYSTKVIYWREVAIVNDLLYKKVNSNKTFNHVFIRTKQNDYLYSPYYFDCPGYINATGISSNKYLPCFIGYLEEDTISKTLRYSHPIDSDHYKKFLELPDECKNCKLTAICMRCMIRRYMIPCSVVPALKWWEYYIWDKKLQEEDFHVYI